MKGLSKYNLTTSNSVNSIDQINSMHKQEKYFPAFILFLEEENLQKRVDNMKSVFPHLEYKTTVHPGLVDKVMHWLNPINKNRVITIYMNKMHPD